MLQFALRSGASLLQNSTLPQYISPPNEGINPQRYKRGMPSHQFKPREKWVIDAVSELDILVSEVIRQSHSVAPRGFLEWIADEVTPLVEKRALTMYKIHASTSEASLHKSCLPALVLQCVGQLIMCYLPELKPAVLQIAHRFWSGQASAQLCEGLALDWQLH